MSAAEDRQVLMEYAEWKDRDVDLSIDAFLQQREDEANTRRVAEALQAINRVVPAERATDVEDYAMDALEEVRNILEADRPWIEDGSLTGESKRVYV